MRIDPVVPLWVLVPLTLAGLAACVAAAGRNGRRVAWARRALAVVLLAGIALRPGAAEAKGAGVATDLDVYVLVDRTSSMVAEDYDGGRPRLDGVKQDLLELARGLPGARFALIGYDNNVVDLMPLTSDVDAFAVTVGILHPEMTRYSTGSAPRLPVEQLRRRLAEAAEADPDRRRLVVLVSDGEATAETPAATSYAPVGDLIDGGVVLGYGTAQGARMRQWSGIAGEAAAPFVVDPATGQPAVSRIDEATLRQVAGELDVDYVHRTGPGGMGAIAADLGRAGEQRATASSLLVTQDRGWLLAWPLLALVLIEVAVVIAALGRTAGPRGRAVAS
jgi:Ca-activated chloride channel family protein